MRADHPSHFLDPHRFDTLIVRPVTKEERHRWDELMKAHHYLGFRVLAGESFRYVAILEGRWVALLGWGAAAWNNRHRDRLIGWSIPQRARRLPFVVNNQRFLILPDIHMPHLASKILAMNMRRLSRDWEERYDHPVLFVETFIDPSRFSGTCYKAAGFKELGETRGYRRNNGRYYYHGQVKKILVRPLRPDAARILSDPSHLPIFQSKEPVVPVKALSEEDFRRLVDALAEISDSRKKRGIRHQQSTLIAILVCAILSGATHTRAMAQWAADLSQNLLKRLGSRRSPKTGQLIPPGETTLRRTLCRLDDEAISEAVTRWVFSILPSCGLVMEQQAIAVDGKCVRGAGKTSGGQKIHLLSAFLSGAKIVIAQESVDEKSNEIPALRSLLAPLDISGAVITADAMHTQVETARFITEDKKADYVLSVKGNQPTMKEDIESLPWEAFPPSGPGSHGRQGTRPY